jgi:hypothetical protein
VFDPGAGGAVDDVEFLLDDGLGDEHHVRDTPHGGIEAGWNLKICLEDIDAVPGQRSGLVRAADQDADRFSSLGELSCCF